MSYRWILFDADDTLFDFARSSAVALRETIEAHGAAHDADHLPTYRRVNARFWEAYERGEIDQVQLRAERFVALLAEVGLTELDAGRFAIDYERNLSRGTHLVDGALEILAALQPHVEMALITNGLVDVQRPRLAASPIQHFFREILISEEVGAAKPDPKIFEIAFERMGEPAKEEVLIVGDSLSSDIAGGANFGIDTCWFHREPLAAGRQVDVTYQIERLDELVAIVDGRSGERVQTR